MPTPEQMTASVHAYVDGFARGDAAAVAALFADNAIVTDPVGSEPKTGRAAFAPFFEQTVGSGAKLTIDGPLRMGDDFVAFAFHVAINWHGKPMRIDVIDVFLFDADGKIRKMDAYFGPANFLPASQGD